jgi:hypothetical protein
MQQSRHVDVGADFQLPDTIVWLAANRTVIRKIIQILKNLPGILPLQKHNSANSIAT